MLNQLENTLDDHRTSPSSLVQQTGNTQWQAVYHHRRLEGDLSLDQISYVMNTSAADIHCQ